MHKKLALILVLLILAGCSKTSDAPLKRFSKSGEFFSSVVNVDVCYAPGQEVALKRATDEIWARFADIHWRLSVYDPNSDMNRINSSYPNSVTVGADTYGIIADSLYYNRLSDGMFDITVYPLLKLWKTDEKKNILPSVEEIRAAQAMMGSDKVQLLDKNQIRLLNPDTKLTIDSIADGYAADEAARILRAHGFSNFLVDTSGELYGGGHNCQGGPWRIGVKDPHDPTHIIDVIEMTNTSVTTSGSYEHFYMIDGKQYSHIIDPKTGFPHNNLISATVIAPSAEFSDFWSTALCLLNPQRGIELINSLGEGYASMVVVKEGNGKFVKKASRNYARYLSKNLY